MADADDVVRTGTTPLPPTVDGKPEPGNRHIVKRPLDEPAYGAYEYIQRPVSPCNRNDLRVRGQLQGFMSISVGDASPKLFEGEADALLLPPSSRRMRRGRITSLDRRPLSFRASRSIIAQDRRTGTRIHAVLLETPHSARSRPRSRCRRGIRSAETARPRLALLSRSRPLGHSPKGEIVQHPVPNGALLLRHRRAFPSPSASPAAISRPFGCPLTSRIAPGTWATPRQHPVVGISPGVAKRRSGRYFWARLKGATPLLETRRGRLALSLHATQSLISLLVTRRSAPL